MRPATRRSRYPIVVIAVSVILTPVAGHAAGTDRKPPPPLAAVTQAAERSPYVFAPEVQAVGRPVWQGNYQQDLDRAKLVGFKWLFLSVQWSYVQAINGTIDLSGLDKVVAAAHDAGIQLVLNLETCDFSEPQPPALTGGGYRSNSNHPGLPSCAPKNIKAALPAWSAVFRRYAPAGGLARQNAWTDGYGVLHYEVENEPDSLTWTTGNYSSVAKDYALFVRDLALAAHAVDPRITLLAPALSQGASATTWLANVLSTDPATMTEASDAYRSAVANGAPIVGAGPYIGAYSYHEDFADPGSRLLERRPRQIRAVIAKYDEQPGYPTAAKPALWCTECNAGYLSSKTETSQLDWSYAEAQYMLETIDAGVAHLMADFSTNNTDETATFVSEPGYRMARAFTTYFPTITAWSNRSAQMTAHAEHHNSVTAFVRRSPNGMRRSLALFAPDLPDQRDDNTPTIGTPLASVGPSFRVTVPVRHKHVIVIDDAWQSRRATAVRGHVTVTLRRGHPSPVVMVIDSRYGLDAASEHASHNVTRLTY